MIPRKRLDIGWTDLALGLARCIVTTDRAATLASVERLWSPGGDALATLSVRSGFDLVLRCLALPRGSEILVSAITIRDMVALIDRHGLRAVPVDIGPETCALRCDLLERAITPRTRAILVAHLFGSRMPMDGIVAFAQCHGLVLFEDCAQAFAADGYRGHAGSDVAMFSFGPIKTATALGGAMIGFRDRSLRDAARAIELEQPVQSRGSFARRLLKYAALKALSQRGLYTVFALLCRAAGTTHDRIVAGALRGFPSGELLRGLRRQPSTALLALLERRLRRYAPECLAPRMAASALTAACLGELPRPGRRAPSHTHWVFPIRSAAPDALVRQLWREGFDATRGASSMYAVPASRDHPAQAIDAHRLMQEIVYLPIDSGASRTELQRLAAAVLRVEASSRRANPPLRTNEIVSLTADGPISGDPMTKSRNATVRSS